MIKSFILSPIIFSVLINLSLAADGQTCNTDIECAQLFVCRTNICVHSPLFPLTGREIIGLALITFLAGLANTGGLGGGMLITPVLRVIFNYSENNAITIVYGLIFGGAFGNFINVVKRRDSKTGRPLIEYNLALICTPLMILGTNVGVIFERISPSLIILMGIMCLTTYGFTQILKKAKREYRTETLEKTSLMTDLSRKNDASLQDRFILRQSRDREPVDNDYDNKIFPKRKFFRIIGVVVLNMIVDVLRGSPTIHSIIGITYCGNTYWLLFGVICIICTLFWVLNMRYVRSIIMTRKIHEIPPLDENFELTNEHLVKMSVLSLFTGVLAGLLGVGGGLVIGPTLLNMGVSPQGLGATSGFLIVQTSIISFFQALLYGDLSFQNQGLMVILSIIGGFLVSYGLNWVVKKLRRPSLILWTIVGVLGLNLLVTPTFEILENWGNYQSLLQFNSLC